MIGRALVVTALLGAAGSFAALRASEEPPVTREALASLPMQIGDWRGIDAAPFADDVELFRQRIIRIYDITFDLDVLLKSDKFVYSVVDQPELQKKMGSSELHHLLGKYVDRAERECGRRGKTLLGAAYRCQVPIYTSSPGDSTIGMNIAARALTGGKLEVDVNRDVNESAAMVYRAKQRGASAVIILGGGSPKNFLLQTEPQLQEVLGLEMTGHDYFVQITDARPDTGGLSGATPGEAVSWGKVDPAKLPDSVVCYADSTIVFPLTTDLLSHFQRAGQVPEARD